jgi:NAD+ synthase (glutamine-hydrolysing)
VPIAAYPSDVTRLRVALCQINPTVGDLEGNRRRISEAYQQAEEQDADVALFPELCITGYPPEDLLLKPGFVADNREVLDKLAAATGRCALVVGFVDQGRDLYNAAAVCASGRVVGTYRKRLLPNYAVFDEQRYFAAGAEPLQLYEIAGVKVGLSICEDVWSPDGPLADHAAGGAEVVLNLNASPWYVGRGAERDRMLATRALDASCALVYVNQVGGQDELVFDGASIVLDADGTTLARLPQFVEAVEVIDLTVRPVFRKRLLDPRGRAVSQALPVEPTVRVTPDDSRSVAPTGSPRHAAVLESTAELYEGLVLGTRDYVRKTGFTDALIGLSGGIDSTLVACIAADALGPEHVHGVSMPSRYSSQHSRDDAAVLAEALGLDYRTIAIEPGHAAYAEMVLSSDEDRSEGLAEENLQSRLRGIILMTLSNMHRGWMVLTTGNKSEMAVGYSTLYGDTAGGYAVIKDVFKLKVYDLCRFVNERAGEEIVGESVLTKPPSAELRPDQRDDQSLPPYEVLDPLLTAYVERDMTQGELVDAGFDPALVARITRLVDTAEYKRRQNPPGVRVTPKAFGKDRRMPIVNGYRG